MTEKVICFRKSLLEGCALPGPVFYSSGLWNVILSNLEPLPREDAEQNYSYKQVVVYAVIKSKDKYLSYRRTVMTTEKRLRSKHSIGIGGHVNTGDERQLTLFGSKPWETFLAEALWREVNEEVRIDSSVLSEPQMLCFINDDSTDVGRVHFGIVWLIEADEPRVSSRKEKGVGKLEFAGLDELAGRKESMENWSRFLVEYLLDKGT